MDRLYEAARKQHGKVDIVVANAGILEKAPIGEISEAHFDRLFSTNVKGVVFAVQKALPLMPDGGSIILMSSMVANKGLGRNSLYAATKAAIRNFARGWIIDLKDRRIRVNAISPGPVQTAGLASGVSDPSRTREVFDSLAAQIPSGRLGRPEDIAKAAVFLASENQLSSTALIFRSMEAGRKFERVSGRRGTSPRYITCTRSEM